MTNFYDEIKDLAAASIPANESQRDTVITFRYFGWDGEGGCSMQDAGSEHNLTRERVRQVSGRVVKLMKTNEGKFLKSLPELLSMINGLAPGSAERIEYILRSNGFIGDQRLEGILNAAKQFNKPGKFLRIVEEFGHRFVILPDMDKCAGDIMSRAQRLTGHKGLFHINELLEAAPGLPRESALAFIRDVLSSRKDAIWLDGEAYNWVWLKDASRNRVITCLSKMMTVFASTTVDNIVTGVNRYFRKGDYSKKKIAPPKLEAPYDVMVEFLNSWGQVTCSRAGIVRKTDSFSPCIEPLEMEETIAMYILNTPERMVREKELENALVPYEGENHAKKYNFSIALNYSPLIARQKGDDGKPIRGQYVATGTI